MSVYCCGAIFALLVLALIICYAPCILASMVDDDWLDAYLERTKQLDERNKHHD